MQKGIDFLDRFSNFVKERAAIEEEYAMKLRFPFFKNLKKIFNDL